MQFVVIRQAADSAVLLEDRESAVQHDELCALAEWLRCHDSIPSYYLTSTAVEAQATAKWLCRELGGDPTMQALEVLTPGFQQPSVKHLASHIPVIEQKTDDVRVVAIIGNEPRLQALVHAMTEVWYRPLEPTQALLLEKADWSRLEAGKVKVKPEFRSPVPREPAQAVSTTATNRYETISSSIRATDDISFKLLGLVPLLSGVGILALLRGPKDRLSSAGVAFFAVFAALITFALYRWELRNVQNCGWFRDRLAEIERDEFGLLSGHYLLQPDPPKLSIFGWHVPMGKLEAETLLYYTTIAAWMILACYGVIRALGLDPLR